MLVHEVMTTEKVPFNYRVAGMGSRFLAWLVDLGLILLLTFVGILVSSVLDVGRAGLGMAVLMLWTFALQWGYFLLFEWLWHGQTPGKRLLGIRVIDGHGTSVSFGQSAVRNLLRVVDGLPFLAPDLLPLVYGVGFAVAACNREHRRLGDLAANTLVVHVDRRAKPIRALQEAAAEEDAARDALFRQRLSQFDRRQKQALLDLCLRRDQLRVEDRVRLFREVAEFFKTRLELAPAQYQSEEKFILEVAGVLGERGAIEAEGYAGRTPRKKLRR
jgi:uncharacterized RDD family membrane protein YckC